MTVYAGPICLYCKHVVRQPNSLKVAHPLHCMAFPSGVPREIRRSEADHRKPFEGDHGIQFESDAPHGDAYAAMIFDHADMSEAVES